MSLISLIVYARNFSAKSNELSDVHGTYTEEERTHFSMYIYYLIYAEKGSFRVKRNQIPIGSVMG